MESFNLKKLNEVENKEQYQAETKPSLWSSNQSSWIQVQRPWVRFLVLPDFLRNSRSGAGFIQPRQDN
jgi:hypothetical protein